MRTLSKSVMTLGLAALLAAPVMAQQGRGGFGFGGQGGMAMLLSNASVQEELKLDDAEKAKAREISEKAREKFTEAREELQGLSQEERGPKMRELAREVEASAMASAKEAFKPEQLKRLHQISLQVAGASAFEREPFQKRLGITDEQKTEIASIIKASNEEIREIFQDAGDDRRAAMEKVREQRKETLAKVEAKLTSEQKTKYAEALGDHFDIKYERRGQ